MHIYVQIYTSVCIHTTVYEYDLCCHTGSMQKHGMLTANPGPKAFHPRGYGQCQQLQVEGLPFPASPPNPSLRAHKWVNEEPVAEMPLRLYIPRQRLLLVASQCVCLLLLLLSMAKLVRRSQDPARGWMTFKVLLICVRRSKNPARRWMTFRIQFSYYMHIYV